MPIKKKPIDLVENSVKFQMLLDKYKSVSSENILKKLDEALAEINKIFDKLEDKNITKTRLDKLFKKVNMLIDIAYSDLLNDLKLDQKTIAPIAYDDARKAINSHAYLAGLAGAVAYKDIKQSVSDIILDERNIIGGFNDTLEGIVNQQTAKHASKIRQGISTTFLNGGSLEDMKKVTKEVFKKESRHNIDTIIRTVVNDASAKARTQAYMGTDVANGWENIGVLDNRTTPICQHFFGKEWRLKEGQTLKELYNSIPNKPKRHPNCRSDLVPTTRFSDEIRETEQLPATIWDKKARTKHRDGSTSMKLKSKDAKTIFLKGNATFNDLVKKLSVNELASFEGIGKKRASLLKEGKVTLSDIRVYDKKKGKASYLTAEQIRAKL